MSRGVSAAFGLLLALWSSAGFAGIINGSFEAETHGIMPNGVSTSRHEEWGLPDDWAIRFSGAMNAHGIRQDYAPFGNQIGWSSHGDWSLYMFSSTAGAHAPGDFLEFYQVVDLTGLNELFFDVLLRGGLATNSYIAIGSEVVWLENRAGTYLDTVLDISAFTGQQEIRLGVEVFRAFGDSADGWTYFDNVRLVPLPGTVSLVLTAIAALLLGSLVRPVRRGRATIPACALVGLVLPQASAHAQTWIDLTHDLSPDAVFWPTAQRFELHTDFEGMTEKGYYYSAYTFTTAEHGGTHIDAPVHFAEGRHPVDEIPLERLIGDAVVLDLSDRVGDDCSYLVSVEDVEAWEGRHGAIPDAAIVLLRTGFDRFWPDAQKYLGTELRGEAGVEKLCFPGLGPQAARWLVEERGIKAVGIDTASIDRGQSKDYAAHVALMTRNVPAFENVANLDKLPARGVYVVALPAKIRGGSGGPLRIVARVD